MIEIPKLRDIIIDIRSSIVSKLIGSGSTFDEDSKSFINIFSDSVGASFKSLYLVAQKVQKNCLPDLADPEEDGGTLDRYGRLLLGRERTSATNAEYTITVTCNSVGVGVAKIKNGQTFVSDSQSKNPQQIYIYEGADVLFDATTKNITVRSTNSGDVTSQNTGDYLQITNPIDYLEFSSLIISEDTTPVNKETVEEYRQKILQAYRIEAEGGSAGDYRRWTYDVIGVKESYPYTQSNDSSAVIIFVETSTGTASSTILTNVATVIEIDPDTSLLDYQRSRRPMGVANVYVKSVYINSIDITITGYIGLTTAKQNAIQSSIVSYITNIKPYVDAIDSVANNVISIDGIRLAIAQAVPISVYTSITLEVNGNTITSTYAIEPELVSGVIDSLGINGTPTITFN